MAHAQAINEFQPVRDQERAASAAAVVYYAYQFEDGDNTENMTQMPEVGDYIVTDENGTNHVSRKGFWEATFEEIPEDERVR